MVTSDRVPSVPSEVSPTLTSASLGISWPVFTPRLFIKKSKIETIYQVIYIYTFFSLNKTRESITCKTGYGKVCVSATRKWVWRDLHSVDFNGRLLRICNNNKEVTIIIFV